MAKTLNNNYKRNVEILKENLKRGMSAEQAERAIDGMERQFKSAGLYNDEAQAFIAEMRRTVQDHFTTTISATEAMQQLGLEVYHL